MYYRELLVHTPKQPLLALFATSIPVKRLPDKVSLWSTRTDASRKVSPESLLGISSSSKLGLCPIYTCHSGACQEMVSKIFYVVQEELADCSILHQRRVPQPLSGRNKCLQWSMNMNANSKHNANYRLSLYSSCNFHTSHRVDRLAPMLCFLLKPPKAANFRLFPL